ncbi:MAG: hypothetical protein EZS28_039893 [Streblomastix strix]|uniref:Ubiquitin-like domain-containing protein n=1 Tax=Streblomastix strix TaxID=222440 RepID=A0A5J4U379_9EUKA|nr:MAG: hypothetical protein EZS28_039893 [Streblomastix strix]
MATPLQTFKCGEGLLSAYNKVNLVKLQRINQPNPSYPFHIQNQLPQQRQTEMNHIKVIVQAIDDSVQFQIQLQPNDTILQLKMAITSQGGIEYNRLYIEHKGRALKDDQTICHHHIKDGSIIKLLIRKKPEPNIDEVQ